MSESDLLPKLEYRAVIKFLHLKGKQTREIYEEMKGVYGEQCPSLSTVKTWKRHLKCGRTSLEDQPKKGRPCSAVDADTVKKVEKLVMEDRRITIHSIVPEVGISYGSVSTILHDHLHLCKVSTWWVPRLLTPFQKQHRLHCASAVLSMCQSKEDEFFDRLVVMDECWVYHFDPESVSKGWKHTSSPPPKKAYIQPSIKKVLLSVFWDSEGVFLTDYLTYSHGIKQEYYKGLLERLQNALKDKRSYKVAKGVWLLVGNYPANKAEETISRMKQCGYQLLPHPPYSPDLAPSDFFLFPKMKESLRGQGFYSDEEVILAVEKWFASQGGTFFKDGLRKLKHRLEKCVTLQGDYVEKD